MNIYPIKCQIRAQADVTRVDVYDDIGEGGWFSEGLTAKSFAAQLSGVKGSLEVHINSGGGNVFDGIAIGNAIRSHKGPVTTVVDGVAASIASVIAQAGQDRVVQPGSMMMIHDAFGACLGDAEEMRQFADVLDKNSDNIAAIYAGRAGGDADEWRKTMKTEAWYTAEDAVKAGLADRIGDGAAELPAGLDLAAYALPGQIAAALRSLPRAAGSDAAAHGHPGQPCWDPDGDGDCDLTPEGDTDHDYWTADGKQKKSVPGKPMTDSLSEDRIRAIIREELGIYGADKYNADDRKKMAGKEAMDDGSYPIADEEDLDNAIRAVGRGGADHDAIRKHIISRAKALGLSSKIPDNWNSDGSLKTAADHHDAGFAWSGPDQFRAALERKDK